MWASGHNGHTRRAVHGYEPTRETAMAAFAKSWRRDCNHPVKAAAGHAAEPSGFFLAKRDRAALRRFAMRPRAYLIGSTSNVSGS